ncbi:hypothetical protein [Methylobacillus flagellatus]|nr:hypothetical protein [Methylobacillus flagellatus]ABZ07156.1 hypothetical protein ALOHA_HF4000ANIW133B20ctg2g8 [uncultured marine microorganism HF4000_ANIW133B20]
MTLATRDGRLCIMSGASRSGKTAMTVRLVRQGKFKAVFVWDIEDQWSKLQGYKRITAFADLLEVVKKGKPGKYAYVSQGDMKADFDRFCRAVFHYGSYFGECAAVLEELADVTTMSKAPEGWGILVRRGLKRGISLFPISQRWAEADKTAIGNATDFYVFRAATGSDVDYMAKKTGLPRERIAHLQPLEYLHKDALTGQVTGSKLTFR